MMRSAMEKFELKISAPLKFCKIIGTEPEHQRVKTKDRLIEYAVEKFELEILAPLKFCKLDGTHLG